MKKSLIAATLLVAAFTSCKKDDPVETNSGETITTFRITFTPTGGGAAQTFEFRDYDGPGGFDPEKDVITLNGNTTYNFSVQMLNEATSPVADITTEIEAENTSHRIYYLPTLPSAIVISGLDTDDNGVTLGLTGTATTGPVGNGNLRVILRHYAGNPPGKEESDPSSSSKASSDLDITFDTVLL